MKRMVILYEKKKKNRYSGKDLLKTKVLTVATS